MPNRHSNEFAKLTDLDRRHATEEHQLLGAVAADAGCQISVGAIIRINSATHQSLARQIFGTSLARARRVIDTGYWL